MAVPQAYLDQLRSQFGAGMGSVRNSDQRSADQNSTSSGNPNLINNQPQYTSPLARSQFFNSLAQDPTNIQYQSQYQQAPPQQGQQPGIGNMQPGYAAPRMMPPVNGGSQPQGYGSMPPVNYGQQPGVSNQQLMQAQQQMPNVNYNAPQPTGFGGVAGSMGNQGGAYGNMWGSNNAGGGFTNGGAPGQFNLTPGYGGGAGNSYRRPMYR